MPRLELPGYLGEKLSWTSALGRDVSALVDAVSVIATRSSTPFFPAYTDHGIDHLAAVLRWCVELTPAEAVPLLGEEDAGVIVGAALLHDIGMHLSEEGFAELVGGAGPWQPLDWFRDPHDGRVQDQPWPDLWEEFKRDARHFDHTEIVRLLGPHHEGTPKIVFDDGVDPAALDRWDKLYVGEFLRRHHARLAHEIAVFGFPGLGDEWPSPPERPRSVTDVRNLMGLVARSHNERLRMVVDHLDHHEDDQAPAGVHVPFVAALLRIADYAQLGADRAPSILLRMTAPQSPVSIQAWKDHEAVTKVEPHDSRDPFALRFRVSPDIELSTYLQVDTLLDGLQEELDQCAAVLAEVYGRESKLAGLAKQRVRSNMDAPAFRDALPFVPRESRLRSAEDMFRLVIHDLYGDHPWVAGRELAQNALDAVRERWRVEASGTVRAPDEDWPDPEDGSVDVLVEVVVGDDDQLTLRIADRGIGMTADTVVDYFLKAGASLGPTPRELAEVPRADAARYAKAGRFGIGVLAAFLLGDEVEVRTRHLTEETGLSFTAKLDSDLVPVARGIDMPVGTEVRVGVAAPELALLVAAVKDDERTNLVLKHRFEAPGLHERVGAAVLADRVAMHLIGTEVTTVIRMSGSRLGKFDRRRIGFDVVRWADEDWRAVEGLEDGIAVRWRPTERPARIFHNGVLIHDPDAKAVAGTYRWGHPGEATVLQRPTVVVRDPVSVLPLSLTRFRLRTPRLPFEASLVRSLVCEVAAAAIVRGVVSDRLLVRGWTQPLLTERGWLIPLPGLAATLGLETIDVVAKLVGAGARIQGAPLTGLDPPALVTVPGAVVWPRNGVDVGWRHTDEQARNLDGFVRQGLATMASQIAVLGVRPLRLRFVAANRTWSDRARVAAARTQMPDVRDLSVAPEDPVLGAMDDDGDLRLAVAISAGLPSKNQGRSTVSARTWMEVVGGVIPYDDAERMAMAERIYDEHPEMRPHMDRQRRLAAEGAAAEADED